MKLPVRKYNQKELRYPSTSDLERLRAADKDFEYISGKIEIEERLPWNRLSEARRFEILDHRRNARRVVYALIGLFAIFENRGNTAREVGVKEQTSDATYVVNTIYQNASLGDKFNFSYVNPIQRAAITEKDGRGLLGWVSPGNDDQIEVTLGQSCLAGTAYDTTTSIISGRASGELSAVASVSATTDGISIHPAGSDAPPLEFSYIEGKLKADSRTTNTLMANGCNPDSTVISSRTVDRTLIEEIELDQIKNKDS